MILFVLQTRYSKTDGGIAQLGERLNGIQEVSGSIPLISTKNKPQSLGFVVCSLQKNQRGIGYLDRKGPERISIEVRSGPFFLFRISL